MLHPLSLKAKRRDPFLPGMHHICHVQKYSSWQVSIIKPISCHPWCCCVVFSLCQLPQIPAPLKVPTSLSLGPKLLHCISALRILLKLGQFACAFQCALAYESPFKWEILFTPLHPLNTIKATRCFINNWVLNTGLEDFILVLISWTLLFWIYCQWLKAYTGREGEREQKSHHIA